MYRKTLQIYLFASQVCLKFAISVLYYNKKVFVWKRFKIEPLRKCQDLYWKNILFRRQKLLKLDIINESHAFSKIERLRGLE